MALGLDPQRRVVRRLNSYQAGTRFSSSGGGGGNNGGDDWTPMFKEFQRKSQHFKQCWSVYCGIYGHEMNDPAKQCTKAPKARCGCWIDHYPSRQPVPQAPAYQT